MIGSIFSISERDSWTFVPGRSSLQAYDANGNLTSITYYEGQTVAFVRNFTYDSNGNCTKIECVTA